MGKGGARPGAGRKKGVPNKLTTDLKQAILGAFNTAGGQSYLARVAVEDPRTFCTLLGKVLPTQVTGDPENPVQHSLTIRFVKPAPKSE